MTCSRRAKKDKIHKLLRDYTSFHSTHILKEIERRHKRNNTPRGEEKERGRERERERRRESDQALLLFILRRRRRE